jgi:hypothetical protein
MDDREVSLSVPASMRSSVEASLSSHCPLMVGRASPGILAEQWLEGSVRVVMTAWNMAS